MKKLLLVISASIGIASCSGNSEDNRDTALAQEFDDFTAINNANNLIALEATALVLALDTTDQAFVNLEDVSPIIDEVLLLRATDASVESVNARPIASPALLVMFTPEGEQAYQNQGLAPWRNLPDALQPLDIRGFSTLDTTLLSFPVNLNLQQLQTTYSNLVGIESVGADLLVGDGDDICREQVETTTYYVFRDGEGDCPSGCSQEVYYGFSIDEHQQVTQLGTYDGSPGTANSEPDWLVDRLECRRHL